jgi:hypothetical protein
MPGTARVVAGGRARFCPPAVRAGPTGAGNVLARPCVADDAEPARCLYCELQPRLGGSEIRDRPRHVGRRRPQVSPSAPSGCCSASRHGQSQPLQCKNRAFTHPTSPLYLDRPARCVRKATLCCFRKIVAVLSRTCHGGISKIGRDLRGGLGPRAPAYLRTVQ